METLRALMRGVLPPAGNPISTARATTNAVVPEFSGYEAAWVDSGTSALALALLTARQARPELTAPEVIVPAYCCPDLAAAAVYAGVKLVVVDISVCHPGYDLAALQAALSANTLAVIAINFLGLRENLGAIRTLLADFPHAFLIEDNAQWFPSADELNSLTGDLVVFSFGRGKAVSLLGGGLLLSNLPVVRTAITPARASLPANLLLRLKYAAVNFLLWPPAFQLLARNPLLKLGTTRYNPLTQICALDEYRLSLLSNNIAAYRATEAHTQFLATHYQKSLHKAGLSNCLTDLDKTLATEKPPRLLRYPLLLASATQKDQLLTLLTQQGLGATAMYQQPVLAIAGMDVVPVAKSVPTNAKHAAEFAERFITLPLHSGVTATHCERIAQCFADLGASTSGASGASDTSSPS